MSSLLLKQYPHPAGEFRVSLAFSGEEPSVYASKKIVDVRGEVIILLLSLVLFRELRVCVRVSLNSCFSLSVGGYNLCTEAGLGVGVAS